MEIIADSDEETCEMNMCSVASEIKRLVSLGPGFDKNIDYGSSDTSTIYQGKPTRTEVADSDCFMTFLQDCIKPPPRTYQKRPKFRRYLTAATVSNTSSASSDHSDESLGEVEDVEQQLGDSSVKCPVENIFTERGQNGSNVRPLDDEDVDNRILLDDGHDYDSDEESDGETSSVDLSQKLENEDEVFRQKLWRKKDSRIDNNAHATEERRRKLLKRTASQAGLMKSKSATRYSKQFFGISIIQIGKLIHETLKKQFPDKNRQEWKFKSRAVISLKYITDAIIHGFVEQEVHSTNETTRSHN